MHLAQNNEHKAKKILCWASSKGYIQFIQDIAKQRALKCLNGRIHFRSSAFSHSMTPLYLSCRQRHIELIKYFICDSKSVHIRLNELCSSYAHTITHIAASKGYLNVLTAIGTASKLNHLRWDIDKQESNHNHSALMVAVTSGHYGCSQYLIQNGANIEFTDKNEMSLLYHAAMHGHSDICELLLNHGASINAQSKAGKSALFIACDQGQYEVAHILVEYGADVRLKSSRGKLPLYVAAEKGFKRIVRLLLEQSKVSDLFALTSYGTTAFFIASKQSDKSIKTLFKRFCISQQQQRQSDRKQKKELLNDVNSDNSSQSSIKQAFESSQQWLIEKESENGIKVNIKHKRSHSARYRVSKEKKNDLSSLDPMHQHQNDENAKKMKRARSELRIESNYQRLPTPLFAQEMEDFNAARMQQMVATEQFKKSKYSNGNGHYSLFVHGRKKKLKNAPHRYYKKAVRIKKRNNKKKERLWR